HALPAARGLAAFVAWSAWSARGGAAAPRRSDTVTFGVAWALLAWLPLLMPSIGWHAYYTLLGACGAWLALGALLARWPALAVALVGCLALVRGARATTPSRDAGTEFYQTRAAAFMASMRDGLLALHPTLPPHSRLYFA